MAGLSPDARYRPLATWTLIAINCLVFLLSLFLDPWMFETFAKVDARILAGEWWRLVTAMFLHGGLLHLFFNMYAMRAVGTMMEDVFGHARLLLIYLVGGIAGGVASTLFVPSPSVGASGAVFALLGGMLAFGQRYRRALSPAALRGYRNQAALWIAINLAIGASTPQIDNAAHVGGLVAGVLLATLLSPRPAVAAILERNRT